MKTPLPLSAIIPAHNHCEFLYEALDSVLRQQYQPLEILVVDDGSTDDTRALVAAYPHPVRYFHQEQRGPAAARNEGIRQARGDLIAFLDNDDLWSPTHLETLAGCLLQEPDLGIAHGRIRNFRDDGTARFWCSPPYHLSVLPSAVYRKTVFEKVGLLDESLRFGEDGDFFIRCWENGIRKQMLDHLSMLYRRHGGNMTANKNLRELGLVQVYQRRLDRIRRGAFVPAQTPFGTFKNYLGEGTAAYDDGGLEPVDAHLFGALTPCCAQPSLREQL
jgi:glycosyltransferase involved in cell wall biosynthesis